MAQEQAPWEKEVTEKYPALLGDLEADICVIGAGMAGILSAYLLAKAGKQVIVLEASTVGGGATQMTTAFLSHGLDTDLSQLRELFDDEKARLAWQSHDAGIDLLETIAKEEKIDCQFTRCSAYVYANQEDDAKDLEEEEQSIHELGFKGTFHKRPMKSFRNYGYLEMSEQAKFEPLQFLNGLADVVTKLGVKIFEHSEVTDLTAKVPTKVTTAQGSVTAPWVVVATYAPFHNPVEFMAKKGEYLSYVIAADIPQGRLEEAEYWDLEDPYHYFRVDAFVDHDRLIIGGEDHRHEIKMDPEKNFLALEEYARDIFGDLPLDVKYRWFGPILENLDGLATIGKIKENQLSYTGFSGNGMTYSAIAALIFRDIVTGKKNPWIELYEPTRKPSLKQLGSKGLDYAKELVGGAIKNATK